MRRLLLVFSIVIFAALIFMGIQQKFDRDGSRNIIDDSIIQTIHW